MRIIKATLASSEPVHWQDKDIDTLNLFLQI